MSMLITPPPPPFTVAESGPVCCGYDGSPRRKGMLVADMKRHVAQDELVQRFAPYYVKKGDNTPYGPAPSDRGCALGCISHKSMGQNPFDASARTLSIPFVITWVVEFFFENLAPGTAQAFVVDFLEAIQVGTNLWPAFLRLESVILNDPRYGIANLPKARDSRYNDSIINHLNKAFEFSLLNPPTTVYGGLDGFVSTRVRYKPATPFESEVTALLMRLSHDIAPTEPGSRIVSFGHYLRTVEKSLIYYTRAVENALPLLAADLVKFLSEQFLGFIRELQPPPDFDETLP